MAYALATRLLRAVKASGLPYTEVAGWKSRGRGTMGAIQTITLHHTATLRSYMKSNDIPTLNVLKNGHGSLPGPLCQIGLGRSGRVYLVAAGIANHAGVSKDMSMTNGRAIGIEAEGAMEAWPSAQYDAYLRLVKALLAEFGLPTARALGHKETASPPGRKVDPSFSMPEFRKALGNVSGKPNTSTTEDDMKRIRKGSHSKKQVIKPGQTRKIRTNANGDYFMGNTRKGQVINTAYVIGITGLLQGEKARVYRVIDDYNPKKKTTTRRYNGPFHEVHGVGQGSYVRGDGVFFDSQCGYGKHGDEQPRLYMEVENLGKSDITVIYVWFETEGN